MKPQKWFLGEYLAPDTGEGQQFRALFIQTNAENAIKTARYLQRYGYRGVRMDSNFLIEAKVAMPAKKLARQIMLAARRAQRVGGKVAFVTDGGSYPWAIQPVVWQRPDDFYSENVGG